MSGSDPAAAIVARGIAPAEYPGQQLPISARPAVLTRGGHVIARREFLHHFDVGDQSSPGKRALEEVVAEQCSLGHAIGERGLERVDVINSFAGIGAQAEEILVYVRGRGRVGVDSARTREHALKERAFAAHRQRRRDAWLKHRVAFDHSTARRVEPGPIQRMSHLADQTPHGISRQAGIGIQRDDVAYVRWDDGRPAADIDESRVRRAAQQLVQFVQFAALALPAHPLLLPLAPDPPPMKQHEAVAGGGSAMSMIQARNAFDGDVQRARRPLRCAPQAHRSSRRAMRSAVRRPGMRDSGSRGARCAARLPRASSAVWASRPSSEDPGECPRAEKAREGSSRPVRG